jgi:hypothetical protein
VSGWPSDEWMADWEWGDDRPADLVYTPEIADELGDNR